MRRTILFTIALFAAGGLIFAGGAKEEKKQETKTVRVWYHLDNPDANIDNLFQKFEKENPAIKVAAEKIPWNSYNQKLLTAVAAGNPPDSTEVKLWWQPQLVEMGALEPLDAYIKDWTGKSDIFDNVWALTKYSDGKQYLVPHQMVILYLYYRADMFKELGLKVPTNREEFLDVAKKLTRDTNGDGQIDVYGFGIRGARGGHDWWGTFVLSSGAEIVTKDGKTTLTSPEAVAANQWFIDLFRVHKVSPPTTPTDGFKEIVANMKSGKTAMTIHHFGSSKELSTALGDKIAAAPVPKGTKGAWTSYGDGQVAVSKASKVKDAAFKWCAFLATAENNALWQKASGQVSINISNSKAAEAASNRFLKATTDSAPYAGVLPAHPKTAEFVETLWPAVMQRALLGEISSEQMMKAIEEHFFKK